MATNTTHRIKNRTITKLNKKHYLLKKRNS